MSRLGSVPAGHAMHVIVPGVAVYVPVTATTQEVLLNDENSNHCLIHSPLGQLVHVVDDAVDVNWPVLQRMHVAAPAAENVPTTVKSTKLSVKRR